METIATTQVEVTQERNEEIGNAGLTVKIVTIYCEEFGGSAESVNLTDVGDAFEGTFNNNEEFAREVAKGYGLYDSANASWPATCINWERATLELMRNYTVVEGCYFSLN
jgi:hypothetical protein